MGAFDPCVPAYEEASLKYHPLLFEILTYHHDLVGGQCLVGSLTGAVASQNVTEAPKGSLSAVGNRASSVKVEESFTARGTPRAVAKAGLSDPAVPYGRAVAQRIKGTPGITGL